METVRETDKDTLLYTGTDRQKTAAFRARYWKEYNNLCKRCRKRCKQSSLTAIVECSGFIASR